jgi:hypothetical protein
MNYLSYPRIHFSGTFQANPSTINNTPNNYDPLIYPTPNELKKVELYWNPKGDGNFALMEDCVVKQVDYADGTSATTPEHDSIIGQPVKAIFKPSFPLQSAMVDLDPMQQNVSEIWAMTLQIGGDDANLTGNVPNIAFNGIWGQCQGPNAPHSSASGSAVFQVQMTGVIQNGNSNRSPFLEHYEKNPTQYLSINVNTNGHNNSPPSYAFNTDTFNAMENAGVTTSVLNKITPMQHLFQNSDSQNKPVNPGNIPTELFVKYMLQQYLSIEEYNANIDTILELTVLPYTPITPYDFPYGMITGTVGPSSSSSPSRFVASRVLVPQKNSIAYYAPFTIDKLGTITLNLGNSLPTETPGNNIYSEKLGTLWLVAFPNGDVSIENAERITQIPYQGKEFYANSAGFFTKQLKEDYSETPLGIVSDLSSVKTIILAEDKDGNYLRADQFVYRMNPGFLTTKDFPRGETNTIQIHALKFGKPVPDGTEISLTMKTEKEAESYTISTLGTSGTKGIKNLSIPQDVLTFLSTATTKSGIATFDIKCTPPGNPRRYVDGQVYFLDYNFVDNPVVLKDINDIVSVLVYDLKVEDEATAVLSKFGRLYKIMGFLTDEEKIEQIDMRNMIKTLLEKPMTDLVHMPVTRDLSVAARNKIVAWVNALNQS